MIGPRGLARTLLAGTFVVGGYGAWKRSEALATPASKLVGDLGASLPGAPSSEQLVKANAGVQMIGGALFALGVAPRAMALVLGASLVPTTLAGHPFWDVEDEDDRAQHKIQFAKNAAMLGGLIFAALDTGGRPSLFWSGRKAAEGAASTVAATVASTKQSVSDTLER